MKPITENELQILGLENEIEQAKVQYELAQSISRLKDNPDFIKVFENELFLYEVARLARNSSDAALHDASIKAITSIGYIQSWLNSCVRMGNTAPYSISERQSQIEIIRQGDM